MVPNLKKLIRFFLVYPSLGEMRKKERQKMKLKVFLKDDCPRCPEAKKVVSALKKDGFSSIEEYDVTTIDGLAEGAFYSVMSTPTILIVDSGDDAVAEWRGSVPSYGDLKQKIGCVEYCRKL